jgi:chromosome segregation ATPase
MREMALEELPTEEEEIEPQGRHDLELQVNEHDRLIVEVEGRLSQVKTKEADAKRRRAEANTKVSNAQGQVDRLALQAKMEEERETERLASEAALKAKDEEYERNRLAFEKEQSELKRRLQQLEARLQGSESVNGAHSQPDSDSQLANDAVLAVIQ